MDWIITSLLLAALPHWLPAIAPGPSEQAPPTQVGHAYVVSADDVAVSGGEGRVMFVARTGDVPNDGRSDVRMVGRAHAVSVVGAGDPDRGWLGVSIKAVSDAMADQLDLRGRGIVILNVVEGSPADLSGLQVHDVVLSVDGVDTADIETLVDAVRGHKPGDVVDVVVLRKGRENVFTVELGSPPAEARIQWKADVAPFAELEEKFQLKGGILEKDAEGNWQIRRLEDLSRELGQLPEKIRMFVPKTGDRTVHVWADGDKKTVEIKVKQEDGTVIQTTREDSGDITVRRTDANGVETTSTYADEEALREADPEAYEVLAGAGHVSIEALELEGAPGVTDFDFRFDPDDLKAGVFKWYGDGEDDFQELHELHEDELQALHDALGKLDLDALKGLPEELKQFKYLPHISMMTRLGKPRHTFEVRTDGTIEVRIRKDDSELVQLYDGEDDLANRSPDLYEKYLDLMTTETER